MMSSCNGGIILSKEMAVAKAVFEILTGCCLLNATPMSHVSMIPLMESVSGCFISIVTMFDVGSKEYSF